MDLLTILMLVGINILLWEIGNQLEQIYELLKTNKTEGAEASVEPP